MVGRFFGMLLLSANAQDLLGRMGNTPCERRIEEPSKGLVIPFGAVAETSLRIHPFGEKVSPGIFLGYALITGGSWKGDILAADIEELETMDASEINSERLNAKEVICPKEKGFFIFQSQMHESNILEEIKT